ncbi:hypothetical protein QWZ16_06490 [Vibrio ostreicida]|uniref:Uncharacterized protein n=1 Tax=Vibrio ostreicida TaxID=526588 RepID=A0ABT8BTE7_9VIBR|nr:hypothetical protein [Vibrio ostreicida]MDN3609368.1 hypothetical protein [Vibrio ostreicida]
MICAHGGQAVIISLDLHNGYHNSPGSLKGKGAFLLFILPKIHQTKPN